MADIEVDSHPTLHQYATLQKPDDMEGQNFIDLCCTIFLYCFIPPLAPHVLHFNTQADCMTTFGELICTYNIVASLSLEGLPTLVY